MRSVSVSRFAKNTIVRQSFCQFSPQVAFATDFDEIGIYLILNRSEFLIRVKGESLLLFIYRFQLNLRGTLSTVHTIWCKKYKREMCGGERGRRRKLSVMHTTNKHAILIQENLKTWKTSTTKIKKILLSVRLSSACYIQRVNEITAESKWPYFL